MKLSLPPRLVFNSTANSARSTAIFAAITALFFVAASNDVRAQESTTNTNETYFDPYLMGFGFNEFSDDDDSTESFGTLSLGGSGGGLPLGDDGGTFTVNAVQNVAYVQQTGNVAATFAQGQFAGAFNEGSAEIGMFANGSGTPEVVVWRDFKTAGNNTGSARSLQVGDVFTITVSATASFGGIGFSLNDGGTQGSSYANRVSGSRLYVQEVGTSASWEVNSSTGFTSLNYNVGATRRDYSFEVYITSESTANVRLLVNGVDGGNRAYNLTLNGTAGANIDAFSMWLKDDWNGSSNENIFWKQETSVENTGVVELGYFLASGTFTPGVITDGLEANSTGTSSANAVNVGGDAGSVVILNNNNTYTGLTTVNAGATARASHVNAFGTTAGGVIVSSGGAVQLSNNVTIGAEALTLNGDGLGATGALRSVSGENTWNGDITIGANARINAESGTTLELGGAVSSDTTSSYFGGAGTTILSGGFSGSKTDGEGALFKDGSGTLRVTTDNSATLSGNVLLNSGTLQVGADNALGTGGTLQIHSAAADAKTLSSDSPSARLIDKNVNLFNSFTLGQATGGTGSLTIGSAGKTFFLGSDDVETVRVVTVNGSHTIGAEVTGGANNRLAVAGGGSLTLSGANTFSGGSQLREGTILVGNAAALGAGTFQVQFDQAGTRTLASSSAAGYTLANNVNIFNTLTLGQATGGTGSLTLNGAIALGDPVGEVNARAVTVNGSHTFGGAVSGGNGLNKSGNGTLTLSGGSANTYTGLTTVSGGVLELNKTAGVNAIAGNVTVGSGATLLISQSNQVVDTSAVTLSGGTIQRATGVNEVFGNLNLTTGSFLDFGSGTAGTMSFGTYAPSSLLTVNNFFEGNTLTFGSDLRESIGGALFSFDNAFTSSWDSGSSTFTITAIPEPSTYVAAAGLLALFLWPVRRRLLKDAKSILGLRPTGRDRIEAYRDA